MAAKAGGDEEALSDINIVPLVDIILVVLIIFMVTASASVNPTLPVTLPKAGSGDAGEPSLLAVSIGADGRIAVNGSDTDLERLREVAAQEFAKDAELQALVAADQSTPHGTVVLAMDAIKSVGVKRLAVSVDGGKL